ncbi:MAG TPA: polysaccharide biosynthesis tyrosine autokinase [Noviherbaspirillum sp.]|uniref:polysaccharide biosynthesis tyrosine autokinase n=1 Tax=Noviherbaspirillum sp. TaxID=1926288 RepID=UPI002B4A401A|nr:polysaccharide biosynthesis tyrosine autokinase [Noviherbaspirillum sp.]HJV84473.1 polysaccharide biosynthesis tyrosine autokinase [Noviherbaspirillum sp.]
MNAPIQQVQPLAVRQIHPMNERSDALEFGKHLSFLADYRWLIAGIALLVTVLAVTYVLVATPIYEANILVQVEDTSASSSNGAPKNIQSDLSTAFDIRTATASEMEILRSRTVLSRAVQHMRLDIVVKPKHFPVIGAWVARRNKGLSTPGLLGYGGYVWGAERADVDAFNVPPALEGRAFILTAQGDDTYRLTREKDGIDLKGKVGERLFVSTERGEIALIVTRLAARPGAQFELIRHAELEAVEKLQKDLRVTEKGKQSGIIAVALEGVDPLLTSAVLNQIGREYVGLNVDRKSEKAQKSLAFLDKQLPELKEQLETSEDRYNAFRNKHRTYDLAAESKMLLDQSVGIQNRLIELNQKKIELQANFQDQHPALVQVNRQIEGLGRQLTRLESRIRELPDLEQEAIQLSRDVKVNTDLYTSLLGTAQQLRLAASSEVGNARLLDNAAVPIKPVKPKELLIISLAAIVGTVLGIIAAFVWKTIHGRVDAPHEIEQLLGLPVSATIPHRAGAPRLPGPFGGGARKHSVLPQDAPFDSTLDSLRRLRNFLQYAMASSSNNIIMITGPTQGVGKSFVSVNFAAVLASLGKRALLIDADLRAGDLHRYFAMERGTGLADAIGSSIGPERVIHRDVVDHVDFISAGSMTKRPAELLAHGNFGQLLEALARHYDYVLIDTPPVLAASDALAVASHAGVILNVVRGGYSTVAEIEDAVKGLNQAGYTVTGTVFNDARAASARYGYGSRYEKYKASSA